jgi:1-acyl-sn-glycerol-3-phosphate acyltransferase
VSDRSQFTLLGQRRFAPFFLTQFLGAFNDNVYKNALVILAAFHAASLTSLSPDVLVNAAAALFILPFFLFSATAGQLADKYDKARIIRLVKLLEVVIMVIGSLGFIRQSLPLLLGALFLLGLHSAVFGPIKYAILPQTLHEQELVGGNALVETGTSLAILIGTILGGVLIATQLGTTVWVPVTVIGLAVAGLIASQFIPSAPPVAPELKINWNPLTETWRNLKFTYGNRTVFLSVLGVSWFWLYGLVFLSQFPNYAKVTLGGSEHVVTLLLTIFSVGIGLGSLLCERMSGHKVELGLVPFGAIGLTLFALDLAFATPSGAVANAGLSIGQFLALEGSWRVLLDLAMIGLFGGFYIVPLYALIQSRSERSHQSRVIAGNNILNALFMVVGAGVSALLLSRGLTIPQLFLVVALMNAAVAVFIFSLVPEFLMRFLAWLLVKAVYRVKATGLEHIPEEGPAVIVCNHVSFADPVVVMGLSPRPIRFVMDHQIFRTPVLGFIFRTTRAIPIAPKKEDEALMEQAFAEVSKALAAGELVGIFPEGHITKDGEILPFRPGISRILADRPVPVVPMALQGLWGSFFSKIAGRAMTRPLRRGIFNRIGLVVDTPVPPEQASPEFLQAKVSSLRGDWR